MNEITKGLLAKICRKSPKRRYFALFSDILVYGTIVSLPKKVFTAQRILILSQMEVRSLSDTELKNGMEVATPTKSFHVFASSLQEKEEWLEQFSKLGRLVSGTQSSFMNKSEDKDFDSDEEDKSNSISSSSSNSRAAVWIPDHHTEVCMVCNASKFTTFNRRHHCRRCGVVCCSTCSSSKMILPNMGSKPVRVCRLCFSSQVPLTPSPEISSSTSPNSVNYSTSTLKRNVLPNPGSESLNSSSSSSITQQQQQQGNTSNELQILSTNIPPKRRPLPQLPQEENSNSNSNLISTSTSTSNPETSSLNSTSSTNSNLIPSTPTKGIIVNIPPKPPVPKKRGQKSENSNINSNNENQSQQVTRTQEVGVGKATVIMDYIPSPYDEDAIGLKAGEMLTILEKNENGLWKAKKENGEIGIIPFRYIEELDDC